ncbi:hypothetical protein BY996DRAFT_8218000 [Phakopsora pachyrhizi]|nr:hypothetical protein BY996DRAFT_8218000 [Phakopsora pachyrhizi]
MIAPNRLLCQLLQYFIGSIYLSLPGGSTTQSSFYQKFESYVIHLLKNGLSHTTAQKLLVRASQLSGQAVIGIRKGHSRAELRVAQLSIWGQRRSKKLESLMVEGGDESKSHIRRLRIRKVELLKQRWRDEEIKMVRWRNRLIKVSAVREAEELAERLFREEHAQRVEEWKRSRSVEGVKEEAGRGAIANGVIDRALSFGEGSFKEGEKIFKKKTCFPS